MRTMRSLNIDLDELATAMDQIERDVNEWYLDTQTGEVVLVDTEFIDLDEDEDDEQEKADEPEWQKDARETARLVEENADRFVRIPESDRNEAYRLMEEFIETVHDERAGDLLARAIAGKGAFRRFKDTLFEFPVIRQQWFDFEASRKRARAEEWLESIDLRSTWQPASKRD
jgi:hypothetical protein